MLQTTPAQYKDEFSWLWEVDSLALCNAQLQVQAAYKNFFRDKLAKCGKRLITIDKWFPSSKLCRHCGYVNSKLTLSDRV